MARPFLRRYYSSWKDFKNDFTYLISRRSQIKQSLKSGLISAAFRERLMLVVTEVNGCRYCRYFHAPQAFQAGVPRDELQQLLAGLVPDSAPPEERIALVYAQHWAENDARPDPVYRERLLETYGEDAARAIEIILRMIRMGNLLGNTGDYILYRLSFGLLGNKPVETAADQISNNGGDSHD